MLLNPSSIQPVERTPPSPPRPSPHSITYPQVSPPNFLLPPPPAPFLPVAPCSSGGSSSKSRLPPSFGLPAPHSATAQGALATVFRVSPLRPSPAACASQRLHPYAPAGPRVSRCSRLPLARTPPVRAPRHLHSEPAKSRVRRVAPVPTARVPHPAAPPSAVPRPPPPHTLSPRPRCPPPRRPSRVPLPPRPGGPPPPRRAGRRAQVDARALRGDEPRHTLTRRPAPRAADWLPAGWRGPDWLAPRAGRASFTVGSTAAWMLLGPSAAPRSVEPARRGGAGRGHRRSRSAAHPGPAAKGSLGSRPQRVAAGGAQRAMRGRGPRRGARGSRGPQRRR